MGYYKLSRLLATVESLRSQYEQAKKVKENEAVLRQVLKELESALAQIERLQAH